MTHIEAMEKAKEIWGDDARTRVTAITVQGSIRLDYEIGYWLVNGVSRWWGELEGGWEGCFENFHGEAVEDVAKR